MHLSLVFRTLMLAALLMGLSLSSSGDGDDKSNEQSSTGEAKTVNSTKPAKHKDSVVDCVIQTTAKKKQLVVRISRAGPQQPPIRYRDLHVAAYTPEGVALAIDSGIPNEILIETANSLGQTAYAFYDLKPSDSPATVNVSRGGVVDRFRFE